MIMKSVWWISNESATPGLFPEVKTSTGEELQHRLRTVGFHVVIATPERIDDNGTGVDVVVWGVPITSLRTCQQRSPRMLSLPQLWHCDGRKPPADSMTRLGRIDGILYDGMDDNQIRWAFQMSLLHYHQRMEGNRLERQLENRKWIDQAKWILHKTKRLSEAEAYHTIRKQAMNERKPMAEISQEIVKVHRLLHSDHPGGE
jgi:response regulator NasT